MIQLLFANLAFLAMAEMHWPEKGPVPVRLKSKFLLQDARNSPQAAFGECQFVPIYTGSE